MIICMIVQSDKNVYLIALVFCLFSSFQVECIVYTRSPYLFSPFLWGGDLAFLTIGLAVSLFCVSFVAAARPVAGLYEKASTSLRRLGLTLIQRRVISCGEKQKRRVQFRVHLTEILLILKPNLHNTDDTQTSVQQQQRALFA